MKAALLVGFFVFCSLWTFGSFRQCSQCSSAISYDDCESTQTLTNCSSSDQLCTQFEVQLEKGADKIINFGKSCLAPDTCEDYSKGQIGSCTTRKNQGYTGDCKGKCCDGDDCNKGNLFSKGTNKGSVFLISVMVLLSGLLLTVVNIN